MNIRELLLGPAYFRHRSLVAASKDWTATKISIFKQQELARLQLSLAGRKTRDKQYYREHLDEVDVQFLRFLCKRVTTGGTSGEPFAFYMDWMFARQKERAYIFDIWGEVGYQPFDQRVVFRGNAPDALIKYNWQENAYIVSPSLLNPRTARDLVKQLERIGPFFLHVYPSSLLTLIEVLGPEVLAKLPVRGVMAGSEVFPAQQMKRVVNMLECQVCHWYGHSEYAVLARFCGACGGFHFYPTYGLVEFEPIEGGLHEIVATAYRRLGTQFVRYRTEDLAVVGETRCPVSNHDRVEKIIGRSQEYFVDRDGVRRAFGPYLFGIHGEFWDWVKDIQFVQKCPGALVCRVVSKGSSELQKLEDFLRDRFGVVNMTFEYVPSIPRTKMGKRRYFIHET